LLMHIYDFCYFTWASSKCYYCWEPRYFYELLCLDYHSCGRERVFPLSGTISVLRLSLR
jgi:hypothetical protein